MVYLPLPGCSMVEVATGSDPSLPNLLRFLRDHTRVSVAVGEERVQLLDKDLFDYPYLYGHGNVAFDDREVERLRRYWWVAFSTDDNYGLDRAFDAR